MTIDRAIEILDPEHREHYDGMDEVNEACRMGMEALERIRWIPCSERLPEAGKILVTDGKTVTISNGAWLYRSLEGKTRVPANYGAGLTVTHWMPLPELPKEENDETIDG